MKYVFGMGYFGHASNLLCSPNFTKNPINDAYDLYASTRLSDQTIERKFLGGGGLKME